jgi:ketosteroid isomerase-like protein
VSPHDGESLDVRVIRELYEAFNGGEYDKATAMLHDQVELHQAQAIVDADTYVGREAFVRGLSRWTAGFERGFRYEVEELIEGPEGVFMRLLMQGRGRTSGVDVEQPIFNVWEVRDGKPFRCRVLFSEDEARRAAGLDF